MLRELTAFAASGAAIAVVSVDGVLLLEGYGRTTHEGGEAVTPDMPFGTVRLRDVFTALAAVRLAQLGGIDMDAPIGRYAADLPPRIGSITLAQLLSHTAGLDDARDVPTRRRPVSTVWAGATDRALFTEPGAIHSPSRHGLPLARAILEARSGQPQTELVRSLVMAPAGMERSTFDGAHAERLGAVPGLVVSTASDRPLVMMPPSTNPMPQLYTTARDLASLMRRWLGAAATSGRPVSARAAFDAVGTARAPRPGHSPDSVGLGVRITRTSGHRTISFTDGEAGYGVLLRIIPEAGVGIAILANATGAVLTATADTMLAAFLAGRALPASTEAPAIADLPGAVTSFAGTYANGDRIVVLEARDGQLYWRDGDLALPVRREGARLDAIIGDGRVAKRFYWTRDEAGRAYLIVDERAYRLQDSAENSSPRRSGTGEADGTGVRRTAG